MIQNQKEIKKGVTVLGSTGSIGRQTLEIIEHLGLYIFALCAKNNIVMLEEQTRKFKPFFAVVYNEELAKELKIKLSDTETKVLSGIEGIIETVTSENTTFVVNSLMGQIGMMPTLAAVKAKKTIGLANKETLVAAGEIIMREAKENGSSIYPIDSEHSAIYQCLAGEDINTVNRLILTASGGPFFGKNKYELELVKPNDALRHPTWNMGKKITVDSATMMNKGLELIEAHHLFGIVPQKIDILVHRESIIHSLVEFCDNSQIAQLSVPDMKLCIQYVLTGGQREKSLTKKLDLSDIGTLTFKRPDNENFPLAMFAGEMIEKGGIMPAVMNAYNEIAVELFLKEKINFPQISEFVINQTLSHNNIKNPDIGLILNIQNEINEKYTNKNF